MDDRHVTPIGAGGSRWDGIDDRRRTTMDDDDGRHLTDITSYYFVQFLGTTFMYNLILKLVTNSVQKYHHNTC